MPPCCLLDWPFMKTSGLAACWLRERASTWFGDLRANDAPRGGAAACALSGGEPALRRACRGRSNSDRRVVGINDRVRGRGMDGRILRSVGADSGTVFDPVLQQNASRRACSRLIALAAFAVRSLQSIRAGMGGGGNQAEAVYRRQVRQD